MNIILDVNLHTISFRLESRLESKLIQEYFGNTKIQLVMKLGTKNEVITLTKFDAIRL